MSFLAFLFTNLKISRALSTRVLKVGGAEPCGWCGRMDYQNRYRETVNRRSEFGSTDRSEDKNVSKSTLSICMRVCAPDTLPHVSRREWQRCFQNKFCLNVNSTTLYKQLPERVRRSRRVGILC